MEENPFQDSSQHGVVEKQEVWTWRVGLKCDSSPFKWCDPGQDTELSLLLFSHLERGRTILI